EIPVVVQVTDDLKANPRLPFVEIIEAKLPGKVLRERLGSGERLLVARQILAGVILPGRAWRLVLVLVEIAVPVEVVLSFLAFDLLDLAGVRLRLRRGR